MVAENKYHSSKENFARFPCCSNFFWGPSEIFVLSVYHLFYGTFYTFLHISTFSNSFHPAQLQSHVYSFCISKKLGPRYKPHSFSFLLLLPLSHFKPPKTTSFFEKRKRPTGRTFVHPRTAYN
jgi:hypothetical protein